MRRYRSTWLVLWGAVAVLGVGLGFLVWSVPTVIVAKASPRGRDATSCAPA